jgi:proteasome lid subunit RPN8/RPN11
VLVGNVYHDDNGPYLHICANIRGNSAAGHAAQVTFTAETWNQIQQEMDRKHADKKMVGWYHTHPGFGIFLSGMDLFIQKNFFNLPWQVAFVYDPIGRDEGLFVWRGGNCEREPFLVDQKPEAEQEQSADPEDQQNAIVEPPPQPRAMHLGTYLTVFILVFSVALAWGLLSMRDARTKQTHPAPTQPEQSVVEMKQ